MICSSDSSSAIIPLCADVTTANNVSDKSVYLHIVSDIPPETLKEIHCMVADPEYDGKKSYNSSIKRGFQLVCPVKRYKRTSEKGLKLVDFHESALGQVVYSRRRSL